MIDIKNLNTLMKYSHPTLSLVYLSMTAYSDIVGTS